MRKLPLAARLYIFFICFAGTALAAAVVGTLRGKGLIGAAAWELLVFVLLAVLCGGKKITLLQRAGAEDAGSMSLGFVLTFTSMLRFGPAPALLIGGIACLSSALYPKPQPFYQLAFNVCLGLFECGMGSIAFYLINGGSLKMQMPGTFVAIVTATLVNYAVNTGGVAIIIALCTGQKPYPLWKDTFLWTAP